MKKKKEVIKNLNHINLGKKKFNYLDDAKKVFSLIKNKKILFILIDDYRIDYKWEQFFYNKGYKIIVLDDLCNRRHLCHYLIDSSSDDKNKILLKYKKLLNKNSKNLLGKSYKIINPKIKKLKKKIFNIMIYFGGGYYLNNYIKMINIFLKNLPKLRKKVKVNIVCTEFANTENINLTNSDIKIIRNNFNLSDIINKTSLYIGSNSSIVNELSYLKIPRLLIAVNQKQNININTYQKFGNYFCVNYPNAKRQKKLAELSLKMVTHYSRLKKLFSTPNITIDNKGGERIVNILTKNI